MPPSLPSVGGKRSGGKGSEVEGRGGSGLAESWRAFVQLALCLGLTMSQGIFRSGLPIRWFQPRRVQGPAVGALSLLC